MKKSKSKSYAKSTLHSVYYPYLCIILSCFILYFKTTSFGLVNLDDDILILSDKAFLNDPANLLNAFLRGYFPNNDIVYYRPLINISLIIDNFFSKEGSYFPFHLSNIIFHSAAAVLLYRLFLELKFQKASSLIAVLFFSVHPLTVQTVSWIAGRNESIMALFILLSWLCLSKYLDTGKIKYIFLHHLFLVCAFISKETAMVFILIIPLYYSLITKNRKFFQRLRFILPFWLLILLLVIFLKNNTNTLLPHSFADMPYYFTLNYPVLVQYIGKAFLPFNLTVLPVIHDTGYLPGILAVITLACVVYFSKNKNAGMLLFGSCWFIIILLPSLFTGYEIMLEQRAYLALPGMFIIILQTNIIDKALSSKAGIALLTVIFAGLFALSSGYAGHYKNKYTFWTEAVNGSPGFAYSYTGLGKAYHSDNRLDEAERLYRQALNINPGEKFVHEYLGHIYMMRNQFSGAKENFRKELQINSECHNCCFYLGYIEYTKENFSGAIKYWESALAIYADEKTCLLLSECYLKLNDTAKAEYYKNKFKR